MDAIKPHVSVCICTYKRAELLGHLLEELKKQSTDGLFTFSIAIVDNDRAESGREVAASFSRQADIDVSYSVEPEQNIALARNRVVRSARGEYLAFIDDDEFPAKDWLKTLFQICTKNDVDGVLGPVKPYFETTPPRWLVRGGFYDRPTHDTGFIIDWTEGRTGNLLLKRNILNGTDQPFRREFGSGGEDRDFFKRMISDGHVFVWCNEAVVHEVVPPVRWKRSFMLKRALLRGKVSWTDPSASKLDLAKSVLAISAYTVALPFLFVVGHHRFMRYLIKTCDHLGRLLASVGIDPVRQKYVTE